MIYHLIEAINTCPAAIASLSRCLSDTTWQTSVEYSTVLSITEYTATTVYDRTNFTILDVTEMSNPTPVSYSPGDFFAVFDHALAVSLLDGTNAIDVQFLFYLTPLLEWAQKNAINDYRQLELLRQFMTVPLLVYTNQFMNAPDSKQLPVPLENQNRSAALVTVGYQVRPCLSLAILMGTSWSFLPFHFGLLLELALSSCYGRSYCSLYVRRYKHRTRHYFRKLTSLQNALALRNKTVNSRSEVLYAC
jgi:hypothetical protein